MERCCRSSIVAFDCSARNKSVDRYQHHHQQQQHAMEVRVIVWLLVQHSSVFHHTVVWNTTGHICEIKGVTDSSKPRCTTLQLTYSYTVSRRRVSWNSIEESAAFHLDHNGLSPWACFRVHTRVMAWMRKPQLLLQQRPAITLTSGGSVCVYISTCVSNEILKDNTVK